MNMTNQFYSQIKMKEKKIQTYHTKKIIVDLIHLSKTGLSSLTGSCSQIQRAKYRL
jgi:hypothetical protein